MTQQAPTTISPSRRAQPERFPVFSLAALAEVAEAATARAEAARLAGRQLGPSTGLGGLDTAIGGFLAPGLHVVHGAPAVGKTAFALQVAATCGAPALYVSAEMAAVELFLRVTARVSGAYLARLRSGELDTGARSQFFGAAVAACPALSIADATEVSAPLDQIAEAIAAIRGEEAPLLVIDSLHEWAAAVAPEGITEYEGLNWALRAVRDYARREGVAVLAIAERNRTGMNGGMNAAAGTRKFEYGGHTIIDLQPDEGSVAGQWPMVIALTLHKNRSGSAGQILLEFDGRTQTYTEVRS
jgi:replicative DNA helicase